MSLPSRPSKPSGPSGQRGSQRTTGRQGTQVRSREASLANRDGHARKARAPGPGCPSHDRPPIRTPQADPLGLLPHPPGAAPMDRDGPTAAPLVNCGECTQARTRPPRPISHPRVSGICQELSREPIQHPATRQRIPLNWPRQRSKSRPPGLPPVRALRRRSHAGCASSRKGATPACWGTTSSWSGCVWRSGGPTARVRRCRWCCCGMGRKWDRRGVPARPHLQPHPTNGPRR